MNCRNPIEIAALADYWLHLLERPEEEAIEGHLFNCGSCEERLSRVVKLAESLRRLAGEGSLRMIVSEEFVHRAAGDGLQVRRYAPPAGGSVQCTVTGKDDLLIARLAANFAGARQVDLSMCNESGVEQLRLRDIPFSVGADGVLYQESMRFAKAAPSMTLIARLVGFDDSGREQLLGEYTFHHHRSIS